MQAVRCCDVQREPPLRGLAHAKCVAHDDLWCWCVWFTVSPPDGAVHAYAHLRPQKLVQLSSKWGRPLSTKPMLGGVPVDLLRLFRAVLSKGGFDQVWCDGNMVWRRHGWG